MTPPHKHDTGRTLREIPALTRMVLVWALYWPLSILTWREDLFDMLVLALCGVVPFVLIARDLMGLVHNLTRFPAEVELYHERRIKSEIRESLKNHRRHGK